MSHLSKLPLARNLPQGEKATLYTGSLCLLIMLAMLVNVMLAAVNIILVMLVSVDIITM